MMSLSFLEIWTYRVGVGSVIARLKISKAKGRYVFLGGGGLGPQRGGSSVKVSTKGGGPYPLFQLFKGRVTPFPEFLMRIFVMLFSIFL